jgi:hypothetical protein
MSSSRKPLTFYHSTLHNIHIALPWETLVQLRCSLCNNKLYVHLRSSVQNFPPWHIKTASNGKRCKGYIVLFEGHRVTSSRMWKVWWNKGRLYWQIAKLFHLKNLVRPEMFGPYHVASQQLISLMCPTWYFLFKKTLSHTITLVSASL